MDVGNRGFLSGIVLGAALGFTAGHLFVWGNSATRTDVTHHDVAVASIGSQQELAASPYFSRLDQAPWSNDHPDDALIGHSPETFCLERPSDVIFADGQEIGNTATAAAGVEGRAIVGKSSTEPSTLPNDSQAVPINLRNAEEERLLLELLRTELPKHSEEQRRVWLEVVRGMTHREVADIVGIWKHMGGTPPEVVPNHTLEKFGLARTKQPTPGTASPPSQEGHAPQLESLQTQPVDAELDLLERRWQTEAARARRIITRNLQHLDTPGYLRAEPLVSPPANADVSEVLSGPLDQDGSEFTGNPFDLAILGEGFFALQFEGQTAYTRMGRFSLNADRVLVQIRDGQEWKLVPEVRVPEFEAPKTDDPAPPSEVAVTPTTALNYEWLEKIEPNTIQITEFPQPELLRRGQADLLLASKAAGQPVQVSINLMENHVLLQGVLVQSTASIESEDDSLKEIERRLDLLARLRKLPAPAAIESK
ncbi:MAG: hypothetical protein R3C01_05810 [Planctomycetaceae bacterium]